MTTTKPQFELDAVEAKLNSYTPRRELHGEDTQPAASLAFAVNLDADALAMFAPTLRSSLFHKAEHEGSDMVDQIAEAADLRYPEIAKALHWGREIVGADVVIDHGLGGKSAIKLASCDLDNFTLQPIQGGRVIVTFRVACHPDEKQSGKLAFLIGEQVTLSLLPPEAEAVAAAT